MFLASVSALLSTTSCADMKARLMKRATQTSVNDYFKGGVWRLDDLGDGVFSYRMGFDRNLIVETRDGLVIVDPYNTTAAARLSGLLAERWPGKPVSHLIYSHYHLDHVRGGAALHPREVLAHRRCDWYWDKLDRRDILPVTRAIEGDVDLDLGGVPFRLLDLGKSHTDTMYAVYLPRQKVLFAADLAFVRALPPLGGPDNFVPGTIEALARLTALDVARFVPSHFDVGTKEDLRATLTLANETRTLIQQHAGEGRVITDDPTRFNAAFDSVYGALEQRYGTWHGGRPLLLLHVQRAFAGAFLGF